MKKIYVAGPLNADAINYIQNIHNMILWAERVRKLGFAVFVPCLDILMGIQLGKWDYDDYFLNSQPWLEISDALFIIPGWRSSSGTQKEIKRAKELKKPVFFKLKSLIKWAKSQ